MVLCLQAVLISSVTRYCALW